MEQDRYQKNHALFIVGMISLVLSLGLFSFSMYLLPNSLFGWVYDMPTFVTFFRQWVHDTYDFTDWGAAGIVFLFFFLLAVIFAVIAFIASNRLDNEIYQTELPEVPPRAEAESREGLKLSLQILIAVIVILVIAALFDKIIYTPPQTPENTRLPPAPAGFQSRS